MNKGLQDFMDEIKEKMKGPKDFEDFLPLIEDRLERKDTDDMCQEYFLLTDLALMIHDNLSKVKNRDHHIKKQIEINLRLLNNPYTYVDPHARITTEFRIKHLELMLKGIERKPVDKEEAAGDA